MDSSTPIRIISSMATRHVLAELSRQFDLVDLIEEELLLSLPLVPKHDVCPQVHESLSSGAGGELAGEAGEQSSDEGEGGKDGEDGKPNPFAALEALKRDGGTGGNTH